MTTFSVGQVVTGLYDWLGDILLPILIGIVVTTVLIIRVVMSKHRAGQRVTWHRNRRLALQLVVLSASYIVVWIPNIATFLIPIFVPNEFALALGSEIFIYFEYIGCLVCPFVSLVGLPEVRASIKKIFHRSRTVEPQVVRTLGG